MLNKRPIRPLLVLSFIILCFTTNAKTYYISNSGNDANSGTGPSTPWQTLNKVNSFKSFAPGDNILFNRGNTFYGSITVSNSGSSGNPITYGAYGSGAKPLITGFTNITSWTNLGGNIWESTNAVSTLPYTNMVAVNGINTAMGRYPNSTGPNTGYLTVKSHSGNFSITATGGLGTTNWTGAGIVIRKERWALERGTITSQNGNTLNFTDPNVNTPRDGFGFFIQNDPKTLDVNGEWYYNPSTHKLRIYSTSSPSDVQIATIDNLVSIYVKSNLVFDNIAFKGSNAAGITCLEYGGNNLTIQNCDLSFAGEEGIISLEDNSTIQYNKVSNTNSVGIYTSQVKSLIQYNNITNINMLEGMNKNIKSPGIHNYGANSVIQYNVLDSLGSIGISFSGLNTQVKHNLISNVCFIKDDGGGICMGSRNLAIGSVIDGNIILNAIGAPQGSPGNSETDASGIMIDGFGIGITIINNTAANCANVGIKLLEDQNIIIKNNTCYNNGLNSSWANGGVELLSGVDLSIRNITIQENIFFARTKSQVSFFGYGSSGSASDLLQFGTFDNNYYAKPIDQTSAILANSKSYSLAGWQSYSGQDAHSHGSPKAITDINDLRFEYNASSSSKTISLDANYIDVKNVSYNGSITLQPYTSAVLIRNGAKSNNKSPVANVGSDRVIQLPQNSIVLPGSATDEDGSIVSYAWSQISGPSSATILNPSSAQAGAGDLVAGNYQFKLTVTDNQGATGSSILNVTVNSVSNYKIAVNVGSDRTLQLPKNSIVLPGSAIDPNGNITSYAWTQVSGPSSATILNPSSAQAGASDLVAGNYQFQLKVTDDKGATGSSILNVTVNSVNNYNISVDVGSDRTLQLPKNSIVLPGSASDPNGNITSYSWTQISGPSSATILNPSSAQAGAGDLVAGNYQFQLKVTDDKGATGTALLNVTVNSVNNYNISVDVGSDRTLQIPKNSIVLPGSASDPNGKITSYSWTQISGPSSATMVNPSSAQAGAGDLVAGTYQFQLTVKDDQGATGSAVLNVNVKGNNQARIATADSNAISNTSLKVDAGKDTTDMLSANSVMLASPNLSPIVNSLSVYPNPAANVANLKIQAINNYSNAEIIITDMNGRAFSKKTISIIAGNSTQQMNVSGLGKGTYIVTVNFDGKQIQSTKLIKM